MAEIKHPQFFLAKPDNVDLITHVFTDLATPAGQGVTVNYFPIQPFSSCPRLEERIEPLGREHARKYWVELKNKYGLAEISGDTALRATNYEYVQLLCLDRSVRLARVNAQVLVIKSEHDREAEELVEKLKREEAAYANFKMFIRKILGTSSTDTLACLEWATQRGDAKIAKAVTGYLLQLNEVFDPLLERVCMHLINQASLETRLNEPTRIETFAQHPLFAQVLSGLTRAKARRGKTYQYLSGFLNEALRPIVDLSEARIPSGPSRPRGRKIGGMSGIG